MDEIKNELVVTEEKKPAMASLGARLWGDVPFITLFVLSIFLPIFASGLLYILAIPQLVVVSIGMIFVNREIFKRAKSPVIGFLICLLIIVVFSCWVFISSRGAQIG
jgi:hypothetical protein